MAFDDLDNAAAVIRDGGGRTSLSRRLVLGALQAADDPVSAIDIADGLGGRVLTSNVSTVYRNLQDLEQLAFVRQVRVPDGPAL